VLTGTLWRLNPGAPWRDLPARYGPWQAGYDRFRARRRSGLLDRAIERLHRRLTEAGLIAPARLCRAGTPARAARAAAGAANKNAAARRAG
jgi:transposase